MRAIVTGGAGFLGSHLVDHLLARGWDVISVDSLITGRNENLEHARARTHGRFLNIEHDVIEPLSFSYHVDYVFHLASPASPKDYGEHPIYTLDTGARGTSNMLEFARAKGARFLLASSSEVYGDPKVHPQPETYWGNVNPVGPRSCYDEAKRFAEALTVAYDREGLVDTRIARLFNAYGPRMRADDGRAVPTFIRQALAGEPITVHGNGRQTRSFCYVHDTVDGLIRLAESNVKGPVNIGSSREETVFYIATLIRRLADSCSPIQFVDRPEDDPERRSADTSRAQRLLDWSPESETSLREGLRRTIEWAEGEWT